MSAHDPVSLLPLGLPSCRQASPRHGFTLAELLIVIGIIVLLVSILLPVVGKVRTAGQSADTSSLVRAIDAACQTYYQDHTAWPGPLAANQMGLDVATATRINSGVPIGGTAGDGFYRYAGDLDGVTSAENLVLGLVGGLIPIDADSDPSTPAVIQYDPAAVGRGPVKLNPARTPGSHSTYLDVSPQDLSMHPIAVEGGPGQSMEELVGATDSNEDQRWGRFVEEATVAQDSLVPEFVDRFSSPLPILYMRAESTRRITADEIGSSGGMVVATDGTSPGVYDTRHIAGYVSATGIGTGSLGGGKSPQEPYHLNGTLISPEPSPLYHGLQLFSALSVPSNNTAPSVLRNSMNKGDPAYTYPYDARAYLLSPDSANARQADRYVIISAGPDRLYGTEDDITNFGSVK